MPKSKPLDALYVPSLPTVHGFTGMFLAVFHCLHVCLCQCLFFCTLCAYLSVLAAVASFCIPSSLRSCLIPFDVFL